MREKKRGKGERLERGKREKRESEKRRKKRDSNLSLYPFFRTYQNGVTN